MICDSHHWRMPLVGIVAHSVFFRAKVKQFLVANRNSIKELIHPLVGPLVHWLVRWLVRRSLCRSVTLFFFDSGKLEMNVNS